MYVFFFALLFVYQLMPDCHPFPHVKPRVRCLTWAGARCWNDVTIRELVLCIIRGLTVSYAFADAHTCVSEHRVGIIEQHLTAQDLSHLIVAANTASSRHRAYRRKFGAPTVSDAWRILSNFAMSGNEKMCRRLDNHTAPRPECRIHQVICCILIVLLPFKPRARTPCASLTSHLRLPLFSDPFFFLDPFFFFPAERIAGTSREVPGRINEKVP